MDLYDIESRLKRLFIGVNKRFDPNVLQNTLLTHEVEGTTHVYGFHFDVADENEMNITIMNIVNSIANLKDHLEDKLQKLNKDPQLVEELINNSKELALIIDLSKQDKHGNKLYTKPRSGSYPKIINTNSGLTMIHGEQGSVSFEVTSTGSTPSSVTDNMAIHIDGEVVDKQGNFIMTVENMVSGAIMDIERFIGSHGIKGSN